MAMIQISSSLTGNYIVDNLQITFDLPLTKEGVSSYGKIENQFNRDIFNYINTSVTMSGTLTKNISEFPHSDGIFQMKNLVLGTTSQGKSGKSEDSIVQFKHIGSFVRILWPKQDSANDNYRGYGDVSAGQKIGKLTTTVEYGDFYDTTAFDHLSLYCYVLKQVSGTLDDIMITVERRPLKSVGFTGEQTVSYSTSGSITEARLRDLTYVKEINYGDLAIKEIGFPIDIPLTNTKEIRVTARHKNGQIDDSNKNLIIWRTFCESISRSYRDLIYEKYRYYDSLT